jgi:hypothetical protein
MPLNFRPLEAVLKRYTAAVTRRAPVNAVGFLKLAERASAGSQSWLGGTGTAGRQQSLSPRSRRTTAQSTQRFRRATWRTPKRVLAVVS